VAGVVVGLLVGEGVGLLVGEGLGLLAGDGDGVLEGVPLGVGLVQAIGLAVMGLFDTASALGFAFAK
jgi:hypothetical protein